MRAVTQPPSRPPFPPPHPRVLPRYVHPPRRPVTPLVAGLTGLVAAGLALAGVFADVHEIETARGGYSVTWWGLDRGEGAPDVTSLGGLALVLTALLLAVGAVLALSRLATAARLFLALGVGSLTGTVLLQAMLTLQNLAAWNEAPLSAGESMRFTTSWGLWLPIGGVAFAVAALVLAYRGEPARVEPNTPRMGFPMPYGPGPVTGTQPAMAMVPPMRPVGVATTGVGAIPPVAPVPAPAVGAAAAAAAVAATPPPPSTSDTELAADVTQPRTVRPAAESPAAAGSITNALTPDPAASTDSSAAGSPGEPEAPEDLPAAPAAPEPGAENGTAKKD